METQAHARKLHTPNMAWTEFEINGALRKYGFCMEDLEFPDTENGRQMMALFENLLQACPESDERLATINARVRCSHREIEVLDREAARLDKKMCDSERELHAMTSKSNATKDELRSVKLEKLKLSQKREKMEKRITDFNNAHARSLNHSIKTSKSTVPGKAADAEHEAVREEVMQLVEEYGPRLGFDVAKYAHKDVGDIVEQLFIYLRDIFSTHAVLPRQEFELLQQSLQHVRDQRAQLEDLVKQIEFSKF